MVAWNAPRHRALSSRWTKAVACIALFAHLGGACADNPQLSDHFLQDYEVARSRGEQSFERWSTASAARIDAPVADTLSRVDVVLVKVTRPAQFTSSYLMLETWHGIEVVRRSQADLPKPEAACRWPKPAVFGDSSALVALGGTHTHRGITGHYITPESIDFKEGREYLLLGFECSTGYVRLGDGKRGVFPVSTAGTELEPNRSSAWSELTMEFDKLRRIDAIFDYVHERRASRRINSDLPYFR